MGRPQFNFKQHLILLLSFTCFLIVSIPTIGSADNGTISIMKQAKNVQLFDSIEFRGSLKVLHGWTRVMEQVKEQTDKLTSCEKQKKNCNATARSWQQMLEEGRKLQSLEQLKWVNNFFNRWPYRLDIEVYGVSDYWASPLEFMHFSGDCEDFSIIKYYALRQLNYSTEQLRIVVLKDTIRDIGHAVLAVYHGDEVYILDNVSNLVMPHTRYLHYVPQYSLNERYRWAHARHMNPANFR